MKKTSYSHSLRAIPFCLLSAALFSGCASMAPTTVPGQQVFYGTGNTFRMNGLQLTELKAGSLPKDVTALMVKSSADARTLDKMIAYYSGKASEAIAQGDAEQYAVAWHISKTLSKARLEQAVSTSIFNNNLLASKNGTAMLPGGARVFVASAPYKDMTSSGLPIKKSSLSLEELVDMPELLTNRSIDWSAGVQVAALDDLVGILNTVNQGIQALNRTSNASRIQAMVEGTAYAASDSRGNKYIVEKTKEGIFLYNPDGSAVQVDLNQLDFMPAVEVPDAFRYDAARIYQNYEQFLWAKKQANPATYTAYVSVPPNRLSYGGQTGFVNPDGTYSPVENAAARLAYSTNQAYRYAMDIGSMRSFDQDGIYHSFKARCSHSVWREYHGDALEYVSYRCVDSAGSVSYARTYVVSNSFTAQSWDSILADKRYQDKLKQGHEFGKLAEAAAGFLPVVGNLEGALRCSGMQSAVYSFVNSYSSNSVNSDVRKFVSYTPETETPSAMNRALDCAQGVSGLGSVRSGLSKAAELAKIEGLVTSNAFKKTSDIMKNFDIAALSGKGTVAEALSSAGNFSSVKAGQLAQKFYNGMQQFNNLSGTAESVLDVL